MQEDNNSEKKCWFNTAAGKISIILLGIFCIMLFAGACIELSCLDTKLKNILVSIIFGIATNLVGIIVTVTFVQYFLDKQHIRRQKKEEAEKILRYNKVMEIQLTPFVKYFNLVVTPITNIKNMDFSSIPNSFAFKDLYNLHNCSILEGDPLINESVISLFYKAEKELVSLAKNMIQTIDFIFFKELYDILVNFITFSIKLDVEKAILTNEKIYSGNGDRQKIIEVISNSIKNDDKEHWVDKMNQLNRGANLMGPYVTLFILLQQEGQFVNGYKNCIETIKRQYKI